jgi:hypothetical protein
VRIRFQRISKQSNSSGAHGSSSSIAPRAELAAAGVRPPLCETVGLAPRTPFAIDGLVAAGPREPIADPPAERTTCIPTDVRAADVDPPMEDIVCALESVEVGVETVCIPAIPMFGCVDVPIVGTDDGVLVEAPIVGVADVRLVVAPTVERVVPVPVDDVAPKSVVVADPAVPSEVSAGNLVAEGPTPSFAAKELKSVAAPNPRVASKASNSGSAATGTVTAVSGGKLNVALGTVDVVVMPPVGPPGGVPVLMVDVCANATQGVAMSATGATHPMILFIPPPCRTSTSGSTIAARVSSARRMGQEDYTVEELSKCFRPVSAAAVTA